MTTGDVLKLLTESGDEEAQIDTRILCEEFEGEALSLAAARRAKGEPLAYILGHRHFWREDYLVVPGVLIPRADTELLVECAIRFCGCHDLATGDVNHGVLHTGDVARFDSDGFFYITGRC